MPTKLPSRIEALYHAPAKAEIVDGSVVPMSPTGARPGRAAMAISLSLRGHERARGGGYAFGDNVGFLVSLPKRESFSPDAAWYTGRFEGLDFAKGAPAFAAEVRSKGDYGTQADEALAAKRTDYFAAGTLVVWDVDLLSEEVIKVYRAEAPMIPKAYRRGELAEAEPAVPGWQMPVDELFE